MKLNLFIIVVLTLLFFNCSNNTDNALNDEQQYNYVLCLHSFYYEKDMYIYIQSHHESVQQAIAHAPLLNNVPHFIKNIKLNIQSDSLKSSFNIELNNDLFSKIPEDQKLQTIQINSIVSNDSILGNYYNHKNQTTQLITGYRKIVTPLSDSQYFKIHLNKMIFQRETMPWQQPANIKFLKINDEIQTPLIFADKSRTYSTWSALCEQFDFKILPNSIKGNIYTTISQEDSTFLYTIDLDLNYIDDIIYGKAYISRNNKEKDSTLVIGNIEKFKPKTTENKLLTMDLQQALVNNHLLRLILNIQQNRVISVAPLTPTFRQDNIEIKHSLEIKGDSVYGNVIVEILPKKNSPYFPKTITSNYNINANLKNNIIAGNYTGYCIKEKNGVINGEENDLIEINAINSIYLHFSNALPGKSDDENRVFVNLEKKDGKYFATKVFTSYPTVKSPFWEAEIIDTKIGLTDRLFNAYITFKVTKGSIPQDVYLLSVESQVIGDLLLGKHKCFPKNSAHLTKQGKFNGRLLSSEIK
jgi:hypothetical protein